MFNPWKVLDVHRQSEDEEIREAYLKLMKKHHPDRKGGNADKCAIVVQAYSILKNTKKRSDFIKEMITLCMECVSCKGTGAFFKQKGLLVREAKPCKTCGGSGILPKGGRVK